EGSNCVKSDCSTENCKTCTNPKAANEACTACVTGMFLTPTGQCIDECVTISGYYGTADGKCKKCEVANCVVCGATGACDLCADGFYGSSCSKCYESCKNCKGATASDCTACPAGRALIYGDDPTKGTCGEGCTTGTGKGACKACDLTIDGTKYCSACDTATEYPQNGVCATPTARASSCQSQNVASGACNTCENGFFKMNGGCYSTSQLPGSTVCVTAPTGGTCTKSEPGYNVNSGTLVTCGVGCAECTNSDSCTTCASGYVKLTSAATCTKCDAGCATCTTAASTCSTCADGYYLSNSKCIACDKSDGSIAGVKDCLSCAAPSGSTGPVLCYLVRDSASVNKGGLSSGAIAGISVAVIVVVGGLVGFLCWWFICRGKA
ncbi:Variant-specific surface protein, partial [Giardia duodenalis]